MSKDHEPIQGRTIAQFMRATGIGRTTIFAELAAGRLAAVKVGRRTIITTGPSDYFDARPVAKYRQPAGARP